MGTRTSYVGQRNRLVGWTRKTVKKTVAGTRDKKSTLKNHRTERIDGYREVVKLYQRARIIRYERPASRRPTSTWSAGGQCVVTSALDAI